MTPARDLPARDLPARDLPARDLPAHPRRRALGALLLAALALLAAPLPARAEVPELRVSKGYGILYLPLFVMQERRLIERRAAEAGLGDVKVTWLTFDGGNIINDAMLAGAVDVAGTGAPGFLALWAKGRGSPRTEVIGVSGLSTTAMVLNTINPNVKSLRDFTAADKIAIPGIKTSLAAVVLQMAVAKEFGAGEFGKLDPLTVGLPHPDAYAALLSGRTEITAHFATPPFSGMELKDPRVRTVLRASDALGPITLDVVFALRRFTDANPRLTEAFLAALDDATALIKAEPAAAAAIYVGASKVKAAPEEVRLMIEDPDTAFSATPTGIMDFAAFMHASGIIKARPATWRDLFVAPLHARGGS